MNIVIEQLTHGETNLIIERGGKRIPVYSRHSPARDGLRFFQSSHEAGCDFYVLIGLGLGYHIEPFVLERSVEKVVVLEPLEEAISAVRDYERVQKIRLNPKVELFYGKDVERFIGEVKSRYDFLFYNKIRILSYPPLSRLFQSRYGEVEKGLREALRTLIADSLTIAHFSRTWLNNFSANLNKGGCVRLLASLSGFCRGTAVVTGAGPSLDRWIGGLKATRRLFFLIATDASVKPLIRGGIKPDLLISIDPQPLVWWHFSGIEGSVLRGIPAVLSLLSTPRIFNSFENRFIYFTFHPTSQHFPPGIVKENLIGKVGSVGSLALRVALLMGFERIILAGFDFSYPEMRAYAGGAFFYEYCMRHSTRTLPLHTHEARFLRRGTGITKELDDQSISSSENLLQYRREIEEIAGQRRSARIQQLNGGLGIRGAEQIAEIPEMEGFTKKRKTPMRISLSAGGTLDQRISRMLADSLALRYRMLKHLESSEARTCAREYLRKRYNLLQ